MERRTPQERRIETRLPSRRDREAQAVGRSDEWNCDRKDTLEVKYRLSQIPRYALRWMTFIVQAYIEVIRGTPFLLSPLQQVVLVTFWVQLRIDQHAVIGIFKGTFIQHLRACTGAGSMPRLGLNRAPIKAIRVPGMSLTDAPFS